MTNMTTDSVDGVLDLSTSTPERSDEGKTDGDVVTSDDDRLVRGNKTPRKFGEGVVRPIAGPVPSSHIPLSPETAPTEIIQPAALRPFKMYPFDTVSPVYSSHIYGTPLMDSATLSPLTSYFSSKKRRSERRVETDSNKKLKPVPAEEKDGTYWERRRKNNEAAKRSRDTRREKEEQIALKAAFLEQENLKLRAQVALLKNETAKLHFMLYNRT